MTAAVARAHTARQEVKLPFGRTAAGRMVSVEAVERGVACECFCPKCSASLVAAKGQIYRHHFRHYVERDGTNCTEARETAIHQFAKQVICDQLYVGLPDLVGTMTKATPECRLGDIVPDVFAEYDSGETVAIEIWVAHQVPEHKAKAYNDRRQAAVEIDQRHYRFDDRSEADWQSLVLGGARRYWLSPPKHVREAREREKRRQYHLDKIVTTRPRLRLLRFIDRQRIKVANLDACFGTTTRPPQTATAAQWREYWLQLTDAQQAYPMKVSREQRRLEIAEQRLAARDYGAVTWLKAG